MTFSKSIWLILVVLFLSFSVSCALVTDMYEIQVRVVDDDGAPVKDADEYISFAKNTSSDSKMSSKKSVTGADGIFKVSGSGNGHISYGATKNGYYPSHYTYDFPGRADTSLQKREFVVLLRKIGNPVPMYARDTVRSIIEIPVVGKNVGFDLIAFDWVKPYGNGEKPDFIFHLERLPEVSRKNYAATLTITFPNKYDGLQKVFEQPRDGSAYKLPRFAPEAGYEKKLVLQESFSAAGPIKLNFNFRDENINYIFRVRSVENDGEFVKAMYGKVLGQIDFSATGSRTAKIYFKYYLNPDYTRNLEFDTKHNLFGELPDLEKIRQP